MGAWYGLKATKGLCQPLIARMPPHSAYIETHLGGGAIVKRKPPALRNINLNRRAIHSFSCDYPVELHHGCCHAFLSDFDFDGRELVYSDPSHVQSVRKSQCRYMLSCGHPSVENILNCPVQVTL